MVKTEEKKGDPQKITCVKDGIMFINCTKETIDRVVENENRRKAYFRIDEWEDIP